MDAAIADGPSALRGLVTGRANLCDTPGTRESFILPSLPPPLLPLLVLLPGSQMGVCLPGHKTF